MQRKVLTWQKNSFNTNVTFNRLNRLLICWIILRLSICSRLYLSVHVFSLRDIILQPSVAKECVRHEAHCSTKFLPSTSPICCLYKGTYNRYINTGFIFCSWLIRNWMPLLLLNTTPWIQLVVDWGGIEEEVTAFNSDFCSRTIKLG